MFVRLRNALLTVITFVVVLVTIAAGGPAEAVSGGAPAGDGPGFVAELRNTASSCTGVLVSPSWVLTAGGCFGPAALPANGAPPLATTVAVGGSRLQATRVIAHPTRDLALVGLSEPVAGVAAAPLASSAPAAGQTLTVSGFGRTTNDWMPKQLRAAPVSVTDTASDTLAVEGAAGTALCRGDAGAPALRTVDGVTDVVGLGSTSEQGGCLGETGTATTGTLARVDGLQSWISARTEVSGYTPMPSMARIFDSSTAIGIATTTPLKSATEYPIQVLGVRGIPVTNVSAVMVDVSLREQTASTQARLWPDGTAQPPLQAVLHNKPGIDALSNTAVIPVGANGKIRLSHSAGTAHVSIDVQGYFLTSATSSTAGGFVPVPQSRILDTRNDVGTTGGAIPAHGNRVVSLVGNGVPAGTETLFGSVVVVAPKNPGSLRLLPGDGPFVDTSVTGPDVNFPTRTYSAGTTIKLSGGKVRIINRSAAPVDVIFDLQGYFSPDASVGGGFHPAGARVLDTRTRATRLQSGETVDVQVTGVDGLPATGVTAAALNVHSLKTATGVNVLQAWPTGTAVPATGVHYTPGNNTTTGSITRASLAVLPVGTGGKISLKNNAAFEVDVFIELEGWFQAQSPPDPGAPAPAGRRITEDFSYPGAAEIERTQNVRLVSGDGNIVLADCATPAVDDVSVIRVRTTETIGANGTGLICFKVLDAPGRLDLEVPAVYEIRGDGTRAGAGHAGSARVATDDGDQSTVDLAPSGSVQVGVGADPDNEPTTLLQLNITG